MNTRSSKLARGLTRQALLLFLLSVPATVRAQPASGQPPSGQPPPAKKPLVPAPAGPAPSPPSEGAGPPAAAPPAESPTAAPPAPQAAGPRELEIHFDANQAEVAFMLPREQSFGYGRSRVGSPKYDYICTAPCNSHLLEGTRRLALSLEGDDPLDLELPTALSAKSTLAATYESHAFLRGAGIGIIVGGLVLGSLAAFTGVFQLKQDTGIGVTLLAGGSAFAVGGVVVGTVFLLKGDRAKIEIVPQAPPRGVAWSRGERDRSLSPAQGQGLALRLSF